ncbi:arginine--tRNA ligase [Desulfonema limicola]|uniref:arginine--tRNA ligase n=1 Tax=Desulfonema limicola TaxID=45656 RepID=UPI003B8322ED
MKNKIKMLIFQAVKKAHKNGELPSSDFPVSDFSGIELEEPKMSAHGDFSSNMAMVMASTQKMAPRKIAQAVIKNLENSEGIIDKIEIAGPGFINFFTGPGAWYPVLKDVHEAGDKYGAPDIGAGKKIQIEFVSANPTGPLHVGHGRGAAVGDSVANILSFCGYDVQREYYINDSGRQINTLGKSVFLRYQELSGKDIDFPEDHYKGDYIKEIAETILKQKNHEIINLDQDQAVEYCARFAAGKILNSIKQDLEDFGVRFDNWFSEQTLFDSGKVAEIINSFKNEGVIYEKDQALWFKTSDFGDEKDRVVVRSNSQTTYFASDIAYHRNKYERGMEKVIDVWGADHHGYIPRMTASILASGRSKDQFAVILVQLVNLLRGGAPVAMSSRAGEFITLKDVVDEVGADAARFIFLTRHYESKLDFDLELAKKKTNDNPVFYVQYVHARISSILAKGQEQGITDIKWKEDAVKLLKEPEDIALIKALARYPEAVEAAGRLMEPHRITYYLMELSSAFHAYYNKHKVLTENPDLTLGRLYLVLAVKKVIKNGLNLLGVSAPEKM